MYGKMCVAARSMPFRCVANPLGDPFGGPVQEKPGSIEVARMLAKACKAGLMEMTSTHDDDLVPWDPEHPEDARWRFVRNCSEAVDICVALASRLKPLEKGLNDTEADLAAIRQLCAL